jgi:long-chain acyl-CoA synthetase
MDLSLLPDQRATVDPLGSAVADDTKDLNNAEFLDAVQRTAATLRGRGVSAGDVVAIKLPNAAEFVVSMFAAWRLGAAVTPINPSLSEPECSISSLMPPRKCSSPRNYTSANGAMPRLIGSTTRRWPC